MKIIKIIVTGIIFLGSMILGGYLYLDNQKIVKTNGVFDNKKLLLKHDIYNNEPEFSESIVVAKLLNGNCVGVNSTEALLVKQDILANRKILDAVDSMKNRFEDNKYLWIWYVNKNLEKEKNSENFTTVYFSDFDICNSFIRDRNYYQSGYLEAKKDQRDRYR